MCKNSKKFSTPVLAFLLTGVVLFGNHQAAQAQLRGNLFAVLFDVLRGDVQPSRSGPVNPSGFDGRLRLSESNYIDLELQNLNADQIDQAMYQTIPYASSVIEGDGNAHFSPARSFIDLYSRRLMPTWSGAQRDALRYRFAPWVRPPGSDLNPQFVDRLFDVSDRSSPVNRWYRYRFPLSTVGVLTQYDFRSGTVTPCSATIVGRDLLLTATHCLSTISSSYVFSTYCGGNRGNGSRYEERRVDATPIERASGPYVNREASGLFTAIDRATFDINRDWAFLRLTHPLGDDCGYMPVARPEVLSGALDHNVLKLGSGPYQLRSSTDLSARVVGTPYEVQVATRFHVQPQCVVLANQTGLRGLRFTTCDSLIEDSGGPLLKLTPMRSRSVDRSAEQLQLGIVGLVVADQNCSTPLSNGSSQFPDSVFYFNEAPSRECFRGVRVWRDPRVSNMNVPVEELDRDTQNPFSSVRRYYRNIVVSNSQFFSTWCSLIANEHPNCRR